MIKILILIFLLSNLSFANDITGKVISLADGDTLTILTNDKKQVKIRLAHIDAPEKNQDFGEKSKQNLANLCFGKNSIVKVQSKDRYKRLLAEVFCDGKNVNLQQVKSGLAWHYKTYSKNKIYSKAEMAAKKKNLGLWILKNPTPPWKFRKSKKRQLVYFLPSIYSF
ncbi:endonuclease, thermonuclease family [Campylobacter vicugnae]|uniref:thermonuclease family protein n=1 Tax=Campylobacter vicugnae TaxID=1660076 RepID=UPI000A300849|nr:thermonuclease family protein [Campylobacter sp. RM12175]ARR04573.1 endonuclease, thermonuclease family [Campylobacter sp. RM12175]